MTALMQEVVDRVHALPVSRQDEVVSRILGMISEEEESGADEIVAYIDNNLTDGERADIAAARRDYEEHPEDFISIDDYMAENGITEEDLKKAPPVRFVYNIR